MRKMLRIGAILGAVFFSGAALAQSFSGEIRSGSVLGNPAATAAPATDATLSSMFDRAFCSTANSVPFRGTGAWACGGARIALLIPTTYYVNCSTGNNANPGTVGSPWATPQYAVTQTQSTLDLAGQALTIQIADGTCSGHINISGKWTGQYAAEQVTIKGNVANPANVVLAGTVDTIYMVNGAQVALRGVKLTSSAGSTIVVKDGSWLTYSHINFGIAASFQVYCTYGGAAYDNANITVDGVLGTQTISAGALLHTYASSTGKCFETEGTTNLTGTPAFTNYARSDSGGIVLSHTKTYSGAATGTRFNATNDGFISSLTLTTFPGNAVGFADDSSVFVAGDASWNGSYPIKKVLSATDWTVQNAASKILFYLNNTASAVNGLQVNPSATTGNVSLIPFGDDTNIVMDLRGKGTGGAAVLGTSTNNNATAGYVGEYVESIVLTASAVSLTTTVAANVTSISLTAGDWDVVGTVRLKPAATTNITVGNAGISTTSATLLVASGTYAALTLPSAGLVPGVNVTPSMHVSRTRISVSATTTVYLVTTAFFTVDTLQAFGQISARRVR